jgi:hypothetical protein
MAAMTRVRLGDREDLGADCGSCVGLCCVALAFARSADFSVDKAAGDPCEHLDGDSGCGIHGRLRETGFKGCTVFDCFGAGQKVTQQLYPGRSWRTEPELGAEMFTVFAAVRRLHELLWYLDQALDLPGDGVPRAELVEHFERVRAVSVAGPEEILAADIDGAYDAARPLLLDASAAARAAADVTRPASRAGHRLGPGSDLLGADLAGQDLRGLDLRGSLLIGADLSGCDLTLTDVLGVDLRDADLSGARLDRAIYLTQMQVSSARGDERTVLPEGFARPGHWSSS